ncbi:hypothetical protein [Maribacter thermophilus]|uniref:hypothetical protein n=1 Tax=Maribacter thermophilus TaxID=1197874 RepID=UPI0012FAA924|nr:hypothetical protein [Maribacter thermophilus]
MKTNMTHFNKSLLLGIITIGTWVFASVIINESKIEAKNDDVSDVDIRSVKDNKKTFVETLTINYEGTAE